MPENVNILIKGGRVIDPANNIDQISDVYIENGKIKEIGKDIAVKTPEVIDAKNLLVCPGFIDMHVHLREPGREDKETIATCSRAAARGGFTTIVGMPNTTPVADDQTVVGYVVSKAEKEAIVNVYPIGSMTKKSESKGIAQIGDLVNAGAIALSDDGKPVKDAGLLLKTLKYLTMWGVPYLSHAEEVEISGDGVMHEGRVSTELGLKGIPAESEAVCVARDIVLSEGAKVPVHFTHVSTKQSISMIKNAKERGVSVTCDTCPQYFSLTDENVKGYNPNAKMYPPLRGEEHRNAIRTALKEGVIDAISTDHAPHLPVEKYLEFDQCANGIVGLESSVPLTMTKLVGENVIGIKEAVEKYTINPARILKLNKGTLGVGSDADITIIDPQRTEVLKKEDFESKGRNTPFDGWELKGIPVYTIVGGRMVMKDRKIVA